MVKLAKPVAVLAALLRGHFADGAGLREEPLPDAEELWSSLEVGGAEEFSSSLEAGGADPPLPEGQRRLPSALREEPFPDVEEFSSSLEAGGAPPPPFPEGQRRLILENEGKGCWGHCGRTAGDCSYCGSGQCCRAVDYRNQVPGCELAENAAGARCGAWRGGGYPALMNEGLPCIGKCGKRPGDCDYCGAAGQCCRPFDGERCVLGCELASRDSWSGPGSQCGEFKDPNAASCERCDAGHDPSDFACEPPSVSQCSVCTGGGGRALGALRGGRDLQAEWGWDDCWLHYYTGFKRTVNLSETGLVEAIRARWEDGAGGSGDGVMDDIEKEICENQKRSGTVNHETDPALDTPGVLSPTYWIGGFKLKWVAKKTGHCPTCSVDIYTVTLNFHDYFDCDPAWGSIAWLCGIAGTYYVDYEWTRTVECPVTVP